MSSFNKFYSTVFVNDIELFAGILALANMTSSLKMAYTTVQVVGLHCINQLRSSILAAVGQRFMKGFLELYTAV